MSANVAETAVGKGFDIVKGIVVASMTVVGGLIIYDFVAKPLIKKVFPKATI